MVSKLYKVLKAGKSFHGGKLQWSLPENGHPGQWHEVQGDLVRCKNGLHLTDHPASLLNHNDPRVTAFEVEVDGELMGPCDNAKHEHVARRVRLIRLVPWTELIDDPNGAYPHLFAVRSPAYRLLMHVYTYQGHEQGHSWARLNSAMQKALRLAIECQMLFDTADFKRFAEDFNSCYWIGTPPEGHYTHACALHRQHGENVTAQRSYEAWMHRRPFYIDQDIDGPLVKLCVGREFTWFDGHKVDRDHLVNLTVTSFNDMDGLLIACSYKPRPPGSYEHRIDRRFRITHDAIAAHHKAVKKAKVQAKQATMSAPVPQEVP